MEKFLLKRREKTGAGNYATSRGWMSSRNLNSSSAIVLPIKVKREKINLNVYFNDSEAHILKPYQNSKNRFRLPGINEPMSPAKKYSQIMPIRKSLLLTST